MKKILTELLNIKCALTGTPINEGEVVRLYDWGTKRVLIGYGAYVWDKQERAFCLDMNEPLNTHYGFDNCGIDDRYDLFRTTPEKLNEEETKILSL